MPILRVLFRPPLLLLLLLPAFGPPAIASEPPPPGAQGVGKQDQPLEETRAELYHTLAEKKAAGLDTRLGDRLTLSGLLEVEAVAELLERTGGDTGSASDLSLATAQLGFNLEFTEEVRGNLILLHEEDETTLEVDEAAIDVNYTPVFARLGRIYVPFGIFPSHFVTDPLTLELGETRETAALLGYARESFSVSAFAFNGDAERSGDGDHLRDWGASLVLTPAAGLRGGGSYLSDLADTDAGLAPDYRDRVGGWSAFLELERGPLAFAGEILGALEGFAAADLDADGDGRGDRPLAWNLELAWYLSPTLEVAGRFEGSRELAEQPERQYGVNTSWSPREHLTLSLEYLRGKFDPAFAGEDDTESRDLVTAQVALAF